MTWENIGQVAVLGLGSMGHGIAQSFAMGEYAVLAYDEAEATRKALHHPVRKNPKNFVAADLIGQNEVEPAPADGLGEK